MGGRVVAPRLLTLNEHWAHSPLHQPPCASERPPGSSRVKSSHSRTLFHLFLVQELEKLASRKLKINAKETMKIAEKLYTQG